MAPQPKIFSGVSGSLPDGSQEPASGQAQRGEEVARLASLAQRHKHGDERAGRAIGAIVLALRQGALHGDRWFRELAASAGMCKSALYARERLARCWTASEYDRLLRRRGSAGARLYEAHLLVIARVTAEERREALVERVLAEGLTIRELREIAEGRGAEAEARTTASASPLQSARL
jgi:hypothetical protein